MTEVVPGDRIKLLQSKRAECSAIARSRKRKLCVLYAVATTIDGLPQRSFADPDAPPTSAAESQFLEACDILQGRRLNELNIPPRPRLRSEYPPLPRPGENYVSNENAHPSSTSKKKDVSPVVRPAIQPPSGVSRPGIADGTTGAVPGPLPSSGAVLKQPHPPWPSQTTGRPARSDPHAISPPANNQTQSSSPPAEKAESLPNNGTDGVPNIPAGMPTPSSSSPQAQPAQSLANEQGQRGSHQDVNGQQRDMRNGEPMVIDVVSAKKQEGNAIAPASQPSVTRPVDSVSSNTTLEAVASNMSTDSSPAREGVPFVASTEEKNTGMKDTTWLKQNSQSSTPSGPAVAGTSESILTGSVNPQSVPESTDMALGTPMNGIRETTAVTSGSPRHQTKTLSFAEPQVPAVAVTQHVNGVPARSPQPPPNPSSNEVRNLAIPNGTCDERQAYSELASGGTSNSTHTAIQSDAKDEATAKESLVASAISTQPTSETTLRETQEPQVTQETQTAQEPQRSPTPAPQPQSDHGRASSPTGVARQKPVAEILSEPPKPSGDAELAHAALATPTSQSQFSQRTMQQKAKLKEKSKQSTVVFGKQPKRSTDSDKSLVQNHPKPGQMASDDYFTPLFVQAFTSTSKWMRPLDQILHQAHKTLSTPDSYTHIFDNQACKVLKRVYQLQHHNKWSLRQPKRCPEPTRQPCHWDVLLKEMKWMRTDFREERKWKMAAARNLAYACAEWVSASAEDRKAMQVNAIIPPPIAADAGDISMDDAHRPQQPENDPTPDLIPSAESDSPMEPDDEPHDGIIDTIAPSAIFALENDDVVFALHQSASADRLLEELPMYGSPLKVPKSDLIAPEYDPDAAWRRPALPLSRFVEGRMELAPTEPPKKRSRYRYAQEDDEDDEVVFGQYSSSQPRLEPQNPNVALFRPENKGFRDRLHAGHQFRPPNEHTMPFQSFYESRSPSQWIQSEDDKLKSLVREYSYNWSLISSILSSKSMFSSGAERRTPWECFERWVMLEGLPHDMQKTHYFKLWQGRIEASQQVIRQHQNAMQQQAQQQQQQAGSNGPITPIPKRRYNVPLKVERRRNQKHLTMIDAMRKLAKKRETAIQKQQHAASLAAVRKNEAPQPRAPTKTPREYSIMRFERDQAMAERLAERMAQQQRHEAQRRAAAIQRAQQGQVAQMAAAQNANQLPQNNSQMAASHPHAGMARVNAPGQMSINGQINGQARPRMPMHTPNGTGTPAHMGGGLVPPMQMNGTSQVQMPAVNGQARMAMPTAQPDIQLLMQAQQISEQQRRSVQMRQQQVQQQNQQQSHQTPQGNMPLQSSPPAMRAAISGLNQKNFMNNAQAQAMMASYNATNGSGMSTPPAPGIPMTSQAGSPRPNATMSQSTHQTYVSQLQHIETQIRQSNPNTPQDVVREMARQLLNNRHTNHNIAQSAMNAAAGGTGHAAAANGPHQYAQLLRAQQQQQAAAAAAAQAQQAQAQAQQGAQQHQRQSSGSATPTPSVPK